MRVSSSLRGMTVEGARECWVCIWLRRVEYCSFDFVRRLCGVWNCLLLAFALVVLLVYF